jgi:hypothetical protein
LLVNAYLDAPTRAAVGAASPSPPRLQPMEADWARAIRDQCIGEGVPFFFKQWGGVRKGRNGRLLDGRTWDEMPQPVPRWQHSAPPGSADIRTDLRVRGAQAAPVTV